MGRSDDGTPVFIRTSERGTWRRCRQKWKWKYLDRLNTRRIKRALEFGSRMHTGLERRYIPGRKRAKVDIAKEFVKDLASAELDQWDQDGSRLPADELGAAMLNGYIERYGDDDDIEMVAPEQTFSIDVYWHGKYLFTYVGKFDGLARKRSTGRYFIFEHKTAKSIEEVQVISNYGEQGISYTWAANIVLRELGLIGPKQTVSGVLFNMLRKGVPDERPVDGEGYALNKPSKEALVEECIRRGVKSTGTVDVLMARIKADGGTPELLGARSKNQPSPLFARQEFVVGPAILESFELRIRYEGYEIVRARQGKEPIYKNPTRDCSWDCEFNVMCELHEMKAGWEAYRDTEMVQWDPYDDHELEMERLS